MANEIIKVYTDYIPKEDIHFEEEKEPEQEWELTDYNKYLLDIYEFLAGYYHGWTLEDFYNSPIDDIYYLRDKYVEKLNLPPDSKRSLPLDSYHWGLLRTLSMVFSKKKK